jgi:uncharacterized protein YdiU (UPF0061 family)
MNTRRILTLLAAALLCAASLQPLPAAETTVDISSFAPRDPDAVLRQIDLNIAIKQYEKVRAELYEAEMQASLGPNETGLTDEQRKEWDNRAQRRIKLLLNTTADLQARIHDLVKQASEQARALEDARKVESEKKKARENAKPKTETTIP